MMLFLVFMVLRQNGSFPAERSSGRLMRLLLSLVKFTHTLVRRQFTDTRAAHNGEREGHTRCDKLAVAGLLYSYYRGKASDFIALPLR